MNDPSVCYENTSVRSFIMGEKNLQDVHVEFVMGEEEVGNQEKI